MIIRKLILILYFFKVEKVKNFLFLFLFIANSVFSQTIINAERLTTEEDSTIYSLAFSYNGTRGNSVTDRLGIAPSFILTKERNEFKLLGGYSFLSQSDNGGAMYVRWGRTSCPETDTELVYKGELISNIHRVPRTVQSQSRHIFFHITTFYE